jgi:hypothetical protein
VLRNGNVFRDKNALNSCAGTEAPKAKDISELVAQQAVGTRLRNQTITEVRIGEYRLRICLVPPTHHQP